MSENFTPYHSPAISKNHSARVPVVDNSENKAPALPVLNGPGQFSRANILRMQQTVGNQAVMRMLSNRTTSATTASPRSAAVQRSVAPKNVIQRKGGNLTAKELAPSLSGGFVNSSWSKIHTAFKDYMAASDPDKEVHYLKKLQGLIDEWRSKFGNKNKDKKENLITRLEAMIAVELPKAMAKAIGLPPDMIANLDPTPLKGLADAAEFLEKGNVEQAEEVLQAISGSIPGFSLIKSMLVRRYIGQINPSLGEAMNNPKFSNTPEHLSGNAKPAKPGKPGPAVIDPYVGEREKSDKYGLRTGSTYEHYYYGNKRNANLDEYQNPKLKITPEEVAKRQKESATKMFKRKNYTGLGTEELRALTAYSAGTFKVINPFLRENLLSGNNANQPTQANPKDNLKDSMAGTGHLIEGMGGGNSELFGNSSEEDSMGREADLNEVAQQMANVNQMGNDDLQANSSQEDDDRLANYSEEEESSGEEAGLNENANLLANADQSSEGSGTEDDPDRPEDANGNKMSQRDIDIQQGSIPFTKTAISALNKLKPYKGKVYRNAKLFSGYSEVNQVGAVVTDMGFTSSTYLASSLKTTFGKDIMEIIQSKNGKFIKPISLVAKEDEVLFKPGTRFKVTKRYDATLTDDPDERIWPEDLDSNITSALDANPAGKEIKIVVIKEEV